MRIKTLILSAALSLFCAQATFAEGATGIKRPHLTEGATGIKRPHLA